jgi:hypothetical protein
MAALRCFSPVVYSASGFRRKRRPARQIRDAAGFTDAAQLIEVLDVDASVRSEMGIPPLTNSELVELQPIRASFVTSTPLFYYILKEAELREDGLRLGPVGARIVAEVAEVFIGLLQLDSASYLSTQPNWAPTLPTHDGTPESFRMIDFLTFAGVDPTSRGQ